MELHGHARIELTNVRTGQTQIVEKDNLITDAVSGLFNGMGASLNWQRLLTQGDERWSAAPKDLITMFYGGLLLYDTALGTDAGTCFAPAEAHVTGTAVYGAVNSGTNTVRGSCNLTETQIDTENGIATFVYDFGTDQGNGVIASVCLTSPFGGYFDETAGTSPAVATQIDRMDLGGSLGGYSRLLTSLEGNYLHAADTQGTALWADAASDVLAVGRIDASAAALELRRHAMSLHSIDLFARSTDGVHTSLIDTKTYSLSGFLQATAAANSRLCCDAERGKLYLVSVPSGAAVATTGQIKVRAYDIATMESTDYTLPNNTGARLKGAVAANYEVPLNGTVYDGWVYLVSYAGDKIFRVKLTDATAVQEVTLNGKMMTAVSDCHDGRLYLYDKTQSLVLNTADNALRAIEAAASTDGGSIHAVTVPILNEPVAPLLRYYEGSRVRTTRAMRCNYLGTINDLTESVEKTADKTMKITYTLRKGA